MSRTPFNDLPTGVEIFLELFLFWYNVKKSYKNQGVSWVVIHLEWMRQLEQQ